MNDNYVEKDMIAEVRPDDGPSTSEVEIRRTKPIALPLKPLDTSGGFRSFWKKTLGERKYLLICFILPALIMWLVHITLEVYPFGENSVLVLDLNGQYVYYFQALRDIITEGGSLLYSFRRSLGGEFMGIIGYYLASPFSVIMALFPEEMITEALLFMFLLKTGLSGLTFGIYIEATRERNRPLTVMFSTMYALCAYAVVMQHNTMWIDNLIWLPLILLGVENLIKKGKYKLFVITLALAIMSNFYIGYMTCIFVALYFFYYYFSRPAEEINPNGVKLHLLRSLLRIGVFAIIAVLISFLFIWTSYYALTFGKTDFTNPSFNLSQRFDFFDLLSKMYFGSYDTVRPEGIPFLYSGTVTVLLLPLYFFAKRIPYREKLWSIILTLVMVVSFNASTLDLIWHGFQRPNWLNHRFAFMLTFFFLVLAYKAFEELHDIGFKAIVASGAISCILVVIMQKMELENMPDLTAVWASLGFIVVYALVLRGATSSEINTRRTTALVMTILVSFEMFAAGLANLTALDEDVTISGRTGFRNHMDSLTPVVDKMKELDTGFYRMEKMTHRKTNDNMALGIYGVTNSTSTLNAKVIDLLASYGLSSKSHWSKYLGGTPVFDSIFGIKYLIGDAGSTTNEFYEHFYTAENGKIVFKNPYAMSVAAGVDSALTELDVSEENEFYRTPFERMNATVGAMLGDKDSAPIFKTIPTNDVNFTGCSQTMMASQYKFTKLNDSANASVTLTFTAPSTDTVYMFVPAETKKECKLYVNGTAKNTYYGNETYRIVDIGSFEEGQTVEVKFELKEKTVYMSHDCECFATIDAELFRELMPKLQESSFNVEYHAEDNLRGTIHVLPGNELIYTSIPYDEGWTITANGNEVETFEILGGLMAFSLDAGSYNLEFKYLPDCAVYGAAVSVAGVVIFIAVWVIEWLVSKRRLKRAAPITVGADRGDPLSIAELELGRSFVEEAVEKNSAGDSENITDASSGDTAVESKEGTENNDGGAE